jgi:prepilin-type N-terminal cleavage/methylation domain-containing protein
MELGKTRRASDGTLEESDLHQFRVGNVWHDGCYILAVLFHKTHNTVTGPAAFTMVEVIVAITLVGIGITSTVAALTKLNSFASVNRNSTGAYALAMNRIDAIQSAAPFKPQAVPPQIPSILDPTNSPIVENDLAIYTDPAPNPDVTVVSGRRTTTVATVDVGGVTTYRVTVTVEYPTPSFRYSFSMSTLRVSDE